MFQSKVFLCVIWVLACHIVNASENSLINVNSYSGLTSDKRAFRVGEPVVILVVEATSAQSSAGTDTNRSLDFEASSLDSGGEKGIGLDLSRKGKGTGQTVRKGMASTTLSARVIKLLPNGLLVIEGEQNLQINKENQRITVSGVIREEDISRDNTVHSSRIADAKIEIHGKGIVSDTQKGGVFTKLLNWLRAS